MIHVCSLARLYDTVEETGAGHIVTLLKDTDRVARPKTIPEANHLVLGMDDICVAMDGYVIPCDEHVTRLIEFVRGWDRAKPMVVHCYAGISRSTAGAYVAACALNPRRDEMAIARELRRASPTATPNARIVSLADRVLRPRRPHGRGDRFDRPRRDGLRGHAVPARLGIARPRLPRFPACRERIPRNACQMRGSPNSRSRQKKSRNGLPSGADAYFYIVHFL